MSILTKHLCLNPFLWQTNDRIYVFYGQMIIKEKKGENKGEKMAKTKGKQTNKTRKKL